MVGLFQISEYSRLQFFPQEACLSLWEMPQGRAYCDYVVTGHQVGLFAQRGNVNGVGVVAQVNEVWAEFMQMTSQSAGEDEEFVDVGEPFSGSWH